MIKKSITLNTKINKMTMEDINYIKKNPKEFSKILTNNNKFIEKIAQIYHKGGPLHEDLIQIGQIALWRALNEYDDKKKATLSTFAYVVIKNDMLLELQWDYRKNGQNIPIEKFQRRYENGGGFSEHHVNGEYYEDLFQKHYASPYLTNFESYVVDKIITDDYRDRLDDLEQKVFECRVVKKMTLKETAKKCGIKYTTFKNIFYNNFRPKIKKFANTNL